MHTTWDIWLYHIDKLMLSFEYSRGFPESISRNECDQGSNHEWDEVSLNAIIAKI